MYIRYGFLLLTSVFLGVSILPAFAESAPEPPEALLRNGVCPVTQLKAKDYPEWQVCSMDHNGQWRVFVGMKSFLAFVNDPESYIGEKIQPGGIALARDHDTKKWTQVLFDYFVFGDSVVGPTGKEIVAFDDQKKAEKYASKMQAIGVVRFLGLRKSILAYLNDAKTDTTEADSVIVPQVIDMKNAPPGVKAK